MGGGCNYPNYWLTRGRVVGAFHLYLSVCMSDLSEGVKISAKLSIQVKVILQNKGLKMCMTIFTTT